MARLHHLLDEGNKIWVSLPTRIRIGKLDNPGLKTDSHGVCYEWTRRLPKLWGPTRGTVQFRVGGFKNASIDERKGHTLLLSLLAPHVSCLSATL